MKFASSKRIPRYQCGEGGSAERPQSECMELDDLDRELAEYNAEIRTAEPESSKETAEQETIGWVPFGEDQFSVSDADYQMDCQHIDNTKVKLTEQLEYARREFQGAEELKKKQGDMLKKEWSGTTLFFLLLLVIMFVLRRTEFQIAWYILLGFLIVFMLRQYRILLNNLATYRILCIENPVSRYVEEYKVNTYLKRQEYWHNRMKSIKEHQDKLASFERKLKSEGHLSEEDTEQVRNLVHVNQHPSVYVLEKFNIHDYFEYKSKG